MKKVIKVLIVALVSSILAFLSFNKVYMPINKNSNAIAIQIGAFTKKENAIKLASNYGGIVYDDDGTYRVYYSILTNNDNINFITSYLKNHGVNYYLKEIYLDNNTLMELTKYEELMIKTNDKAKIKLNTKLLDSIKGGNKV